jgi:pyruvate formate lyase activating enzyme
MPDVQSAFFETLQDGSARCNICERRCVIPEGGLGWCSTRKNRGGRISSITYGQVSTKLVAPIEAKPVFHFLPGSRWLSLGSVGCNFRCVECQNREIAHARPGEAMSECMQFIEPQAVVALAREEGCKGISWTYNEPTMWLEYTARVDDLAKKAGLYTCYVTNGYLTKAALDLIGPNLDIFRVDLKGFSPDVYARLADVRNHEVILENVLRAKSRWDMHVEVVTNVIPGINDSDVELGRLATWIATHLGKRTPWHVTRFVPFRELSDVPCTPVATLEKARQIGFDVGLLYVYIGNVPGHPGENTYCPKCGRVAIGRYHFSIIAYNMESEKLAVPGQDDLGGPMAAQEGPSRRPGSRAHSDPGALGHARCKYCGQRIAGVFE